VNTHSLHASDVRLSRPRALPTLWLCALLVQNGMPAALAARSPVSGTVQPYAIFSGSQGVPLMAARLARTRALLASSGALQDPAGCGIQVPDAVRFLEQATFGPSFATDPSDPNYPVSVTHLTTDTCFEGWLQEQFNAPVIYPDDPSVPNVGTNYPSPGDPGGCDDGAGGGGICWSPVNATGTCTNAGPSTCNRDNYTAWALQNQFFANALSGRDQLRQRVAWALTEIDVVSEVDAGIRPASWMTPYIQLFDRDAFGNYRQLLYDLTVDPAMGEYLNMRGNTKNNVNENYAREILQLFSVGLNQLNDDGTVQVDGDGVPVPTYDQNVIAAFAHVFTGWNLDTQIAAGVPNYRDPMIVPNANNHDTSPQTVLNGAVVSGAAGAELNDALDNIFNHHNVGPFIGKQLIQKLVSSNPSPAYVQSVTNAFNTGSYTGPGGTPFGSGNRGDMQAVIAAVLLDPEARTAPDPTNQSYGHLREPVLFITNTLRALGVVDPFGNFTTDFVLGDQFLPSGANNNVRMDQDVFRPPTVFSYFPPDNQLPGSTLLAPEFAIQSTSTALAHVNIMWDFAYHKMPIDVKNRPIGTYVDTTLFEPEAAGDASALIDDLNMRLMHGTLSSALYGIAQTAVQSIPETDATGRVQEAIYLIASSSQYQVER
jgi:uncharacterized protein (DUF1800 family)